MNQDSPTTITDRHRNILVHMLGAGEHIRKSHHGYRNYFCAGVGGSDEKTLIEMQAAGLVKPGHTINDGRDRYYFATLEGCQAIGLSKSATKRAMEPN